MASASGFVGRVGGLAVFLGVGVALAAGCGVAAADAGSPDTSSSSPGKPANSNAAHSSPTSKSPSTGKQTLKAAEPSPAATATRADALSAPNPVRVDSQPSSTASGKRTSRATALLRDLSAPALTTSEDSNSGAARRLGETPGPIATALSALSAVAAAPTPAPASTAAVASTLLPLNSTPTLQSMPSLTAAATTTRIITLDAVTLAISLVAASAISTAVSVVTFAAPSPTTATPSLVLNGYQLVASSTENVTSFYGKFGYTPGNPSLIQGTQQFDVVDPTTGASLGTFDALVSRGNGYPYTQLIVTNTYGDGSNVGTDPGQIPPVGSVISNFKLLGFGLSYSAMPSPSGDVVKTKLLTPLFDIPLPISFDAAAGIADHTVDNRPVQLANGYYIAPADPAAETFTGSAGFLPLFIAVQGNQKFNVYDSNNNVVGSFDGDFTTTSDTLGIYTQAILVTHTYGDGSNVGLNPGEVPPVGSVYNVYYNGSDDNYLLYSSLPSSPFDVISLISVKPNRIIKSTLTLLDASTPPFTPRLSAPGGKTFVPLEDSFQPSGVNGLPPREVEIQGYQQFDVYDGGTRLGTVDADVFRQWDLLNVQTEALLITGSTGTGDLPPVGSMYNFVYFGKSGFGTAQSVTPGTNGDRISLKLLTPLFDIPLYSFTRPVNDRIPVNFYNPFSP